MEIKIFTTTSKVELMGIKNLLMSEDIDYFEKDKMDSSYAGAFGQYELFVSENNEDKARAIIEKFQES
ncbi:DUF2007 domain-containing protein [Psychroflexus gondwanensis]|jgi:hypothetical protein|uniref:DUF2007 domain-containing protein n=1 Tax=Psychroflexus gondwanensis ACAM 44 TaxID=1189619 RepID=N1WQB1_9FLAO|nr:DUF2007 domain-containing protein [Psychroflexus gondwanensis]EMY81185.1 hypothetical protein pgond44_08100 [Psychroflexus gondwanensis ACAM 44]TXE20706.1 DUF2007 domain-containing protein [Psychroflexus gondwanensis]